MTPQEYTTALQQIHAAATSCEPADIPCAQEAITLCYRKIGLPKPKFRLLSSPTKHISMRTTRMNKDFGYGLWVETNQDCIVQSNNTLTTTIPIFPELSTQRVLMSKVYHQRPTTHMRRLNNTAIHVYQTKDKSIFRSRLDVVRRLSILGQIASSCWDWYPQEDICYIVDRPIFVKYDDFRDEHGLPARLHYDSGPAIQWRDGTGEYFWHNYPIPPDLITNKDAITVKDILMESNIELRRIMCEITKYEPIISHATCTNTDTDGNRHQRRLLKITIGRYQSLRIIEVQNGSLEPDGTRRRFLLGAMPGDTPHDCIAASYGIQPSVYREAIRT